MVHEFYRTSKRGQEKGEREWGGEGVAGNKGEEKRAVASVKG